LKRESMTTNFSDPSLYLNRALSWLEFNRRVLDEALDETTPPLEQLKFLAIVSSNLDEFFEVRVAALKQQQAAQITPDDPSGMPASEQLSSIHQKVREMIKLQYDCLKKLAERLKKENIEILSVSELSEKDMDWCRKYFRDQLFPVLTPLAIDPAHPYPRLANKSLNLAVSLTENDQEMLGLVPIPRILPRFIRLPTEKGSDRYIYLPDLIRQFLGKLFPNQKIKGSWSFRVTRNSNLYLDEDEAENILEALEEELKKRHRGNAVRLEVEAGTDPDMVKQLAHQMELGPEDIYHVPGPLNLLRIMSIFDEVDRPDLKEKPLIPVIPAVIEKAGGILAAIREQDLLVRHPYESFQPVIDFINTAVDDPDVLAIKQTLYRTSADSPIVESLIRAAEKGKQVTVLVELKARFDEAANILRARAMEEAGCHVVYGLVGLKTHCKIALIVRREGKKLRQYVHLGTGNYNPTTARVYTDIGLFSASEELAEDVSKVFNILTGFRGDVPDLKKLRAAPFDLRDAILEKIEREVVNARAGKPARIIAKINALNDDKAIAALYGASCAGVKIDLIIRGICCLKPGLKGVSANIRVISVVDRFLEHSRVYYFENDLHPEVWVGSADWMPRNFDRRVEVIFPIESEILKERMIQILAISLSDNVKAREMKSDGSYVRRTPKKDEIPIRSQQFSLDLAAGTLDEDIKIPSLR